MNCLRRNSSPKVKVSETILHRKIDSGNTLTLTHIQLYVNRLVRVVKGQIKQAILLTIHSSNCPDLTLVDLPGITRIPMSGSD